MGKAATKNYTMDMCEGPIMKKMLIFAVPLMASSLLQLLFNAADIIVVGRFAGDASLAAVGSSSPIVNLLVTLFVGVSVGANVLVARYFGAKLNDQLSETVHTSIAMGIICGAIMTVLGVGGAPVILRWMQTPEEVLNLAVIYLRTYFCGMIPMMIYNFGAAVLRAIGDTKRPLYYLLSAGVINVVFNLIFVIVFHWGVFGVGLATTISQCVSAVCVFRCLMKEQEDIRLYPKKIRIHKHKLILILQIGLPAGIQGTLFSVSNIFIQSAINSFGAIVMAGSSAAFNIEGFIFAANNSFYQAAITFTSQNLGAKKYERINRILIAALVGTVGSGVLFSGIAVLGGPVLLQLYTTSPEVVAAGMVRLGIIGVTFTLGGIMDTIAGSLRGLGYSVVPTAVTLLGACVSRIIWLATVFQIPAYHTIEMVYIIYPLSWTMTALAHLITYVIVKKRLNRNI